MPPTQNQLTYRSTRRVQYESHGMFLKQTSNIRKSIRHKLTLPGQQLLDKPMELEKQGDFHAHLPTATSLQAAVSPILETKGMEEQDKIKKVQLFYCISWIFLF